MGALYAMGGVTGLLENATNNVYVSGDLGRTWNAAPGGASAPWTPRYNHAVCTVGVR
jgi:hypothetical protein